MSKTTDVIFEKDKIVVSFKKLIKNQNVHLEFIPINQYQLTCNKIVIENKEKRRKERALKMIKEEEEKQKK